ncbi:MAG: C10 family peptidase [Muribaculaceae bacterium]|nr:C10 family peptidase [Muribaculaceae bacterium]
MRNFLALVSLCVLPLMSWAGVVTPEQAQAEAAQFAKGRNVTAAVSMASKAKRAPSATTAYYYVFNIGNNEGFVIVSGDDRTTPILGYSDTGHFDETKIPANMKSWLEGYAQQIKALETMSDSQVAQCLSAPRRAAVPTRNSVAPMVTAKWDQARPYWNQCPEFMSVENGDTIGEFAYTGCVATAMAQIMKYHNWPARPTKTIPSYLVTFYSEKVDDYRTFYTDSLPPINFDWQHMLDTYTGAESQVYTDAVAWLMVYAGCATEMQYGLSFSSTTDPKIPIAFNEYFDYNAKLVYRSDYDEQAWADMVYEELAAGRPMIYNGRAGSGGGHSFVCDGYEYGEYYHINWGWGGLGNGYFQLAIMNPYAGGIGASSSAEGYNIDQTAIVGIAPGFTGQSEEVKHVLTVFNMYGSTVYGESTLSFERDSSSQPFKLTKRKMVKVTAEDHINDGTKYRRGIALFDSNDNMVQLIASYSYFSQSLSITDSWPTSNSSETYSFGAGITSGTYKIKPVCMVQGTDEWIPMLESDRFYLAVTFSGNTATTVKHPLNDLTATNFEFAGGEKVGVPEQCHVTIQNNSDDRFAGRIYLYVDNENIDEYGQYTTVVETEIPAHSSKVVTYNFTPKNAGTKSAHVSLFDSPMSGDNLPGSGSVTIAGAAAEAPMNLAVDIVADNAVGTTIYDSYAHFKVDITNNSTGEYNKYVLAPLFIVDEEGHGTMISYKQSSLSIQPGETKTLYFDFDNLAYGSRYALNIYGRNENDSLKNLVPSGGSILYRIERGMVVWTADGLRTSMAASGSATVPANAVAVRVEGLNLTSLTPNANPNTIYFLGADEAVPAGLENANVVKGNSTTKIALKDGYPYYTPQSFTVTDVTYERTFTTGRVGGQGGGFSSIVLPFAPETVQAEGRDLVKYASGEDTGKDYWVLNFNVVDDGVAKFDYADHIEANVPYVMAVNSKLVGKAVTMAASNVLLKAEPIAFTSGDNYVMAGTFMETTLADIYAVNAQGNRFVKAGEDQIVAPFRAYFFAQGEVTDEGYIEIVLEETAEEPVEGKLGDVNLDGVVDVADVNIIINIILELDSADNYGRRAYITDDNVVDVADVNAVINIILSN